VAKTHDYNSEGYGHNSSNKDGIQSSFLSFFSKWHFSHDGYCIFALLRYHVPINLSRELHDNNIVQSSFLPIVSE
jgi:hypothetical protein